MRRLVLLMVVAGCAESSGPANLTGSFFLSAIDGDPLPAESRSYPAGYQVEYGGLSFGTDRPREEGQTGVVTYKLHVRRPDQTLDVSTEQYAFAVSGGVLHIDLCPLLALCAAVQTELTGPIGDHELMLTQKVGGVSLATYQFFEVLPD